MKFQVAVSLALLAVAVNANVKSPIDAVDKTPVERVVNMMQDLQSKIVADGKAEEQMYNKYACWCETTTKRKANDITTAEADLRTLGQQILKLKGRVATLAAEIKELEEKISATEEQQEEATAMRTKRNGEFQAMSAEAKQAIGALQKAIQVLVAGTGTKLLQTDVTLQAKSAVRSVLDTLPEDAALNAEHISLLSEFVAHGAHATYAPQSATIQGILADMYSTFGKNLEDATMTEAKQNRNYEELSATLQQSLIDMHESKSRKEDQKADAESDLADTTSTYDDTQEQMKADIKFFDETKEACDSKHEEWSVREKLREEELKGVRMALDFLTSDEARDLFAKSIKPGMETGSADSFLQIAADNAQAVSAEAYGMLKAQATKTKSLRLANLAVLVRTTKFGHFNVVIKAIDDMITTLNEEAAADGAKKDQCNDEYQKIALTVEDLEWNIKNNNAKIDKLDKQIEQRTQEKHDTVDQIAETQEYMKKIEADRKEEHEEFLDARKNDEAAVKLLTHAKEIFSEYYKKNNITMLVQEDPVFAISADQAPEADFSGKGVHKVQSKGVVSLMEMIIQDAEDEITNDGKAEAKNQADFEAEMDTAKALEKQLISKKANLEDIIAKKEEEKTEEHQTLNDNNKDRDEELDYKAKITPDCDWIKKNFDGRATARAAEMTGLTTAKDFLSGMDAPGALVQLKKEAPIKMHLRH